MSRGPAPKLNTASTGGGPSGGVSGAATPKSAAGGDAKSAAAASKSAKATTATTTSTATAAGAGGAVVEVKDIWTQVIEHLNDEKRKAEEPKPSPGAAADEKDAKTDSKTAAAAAAAGASTGAGSTREATFLVVGSGGGGKTSLLAQYIPNKEEMVAGWVPTPTTALEYRYSRSTIGSSGGRELSHFWELGGGRTMTKLLDIAITPDTIRDVLVIIVLDCSKPSRMMDDAQYWLDIVKARAEVVWNKLKANGSDIPERMAAQAKALFTDQQEFEKLNVFALPTLIVAAKYDYLSSKDPESQKTMARALRAFAHTNGCSLMYASVRTDYAPTVKWWISRLNRHAGNKGPSTTINFDHRSPISVPAGQDSIAKIGQPPKITSSFIAGWVAAANAAFPKNPTEWSDEVVVSSSDLKLSDEPLLDPILAQKNEDLKKLQRESTLLRKIKNVDSEAKRLA